MNGSMRAHHSLQFSVFVKCTLCECIKEAYGIEALEQAALKTVKCTREIGKGGGRERGKGGKSYLGCR